MSDRKPPETAKPRRLLAGSAVVALFLAGLAGLQTACGKKTESEAASKGARLAAPSPIPPVPTPTPDPGEPPSFRTAAVSGQEPFAAVKAPFEADFDDRGRIWILDSMNSRVRIFDRDGGFLGGWGGNGDGKFAFKYAEGLAISGDNLYVADTWNHRIVLYSLAGAWKASASGSLMGPRGVAVGSDGAVWVTDTGNNRVIKYDAELGNLQTIGTKGVEPGEFEGPVAIAVSPSGTVYITDTRNRRIQVLDKNGKYLSSWSLPWLEKSWEARLAVGQNGTVYVSHPDGAQVLSFDRSGAPARRWSAGSSGEKFLMPVGLAIDRKREILEVMDVGSHKVVQVKLSA
jgi:sugar lactone lactonase YvrE